MSVFLKHDVSLAVFDVLSEMQKIVSCENDQFLKTEKSKVLLKTDIQTCINHKFEDNLRSSIHKILIDYCFQAEKISPGGFEKTLKTAAFALNGILQQPYEGLVFHPKSKDLKDVISKFFDDEELSNLAFEAIKLAGFGGKISIEKSVNSSTSVEVIEGYVFKHRNLGLNPVKLIKPKVVCIDGYIESVSEVNMLFEGAAETKQQVLLISRGMHDDVLNTIKVNRDRAAMFIYPIIINFDLDGINTMVDISVACGTNPVSCNLGELISNVKITDASNIDEASIIGESLSLKNSRTRANVNSHVRNLIAKREESNSDIEGLLTTRLKSLTGSNVIIRLPDDSNYVKKCQMIDYTLRSIKSMLDFGVILDNENVELYATVKSSYELSKKFLTQIKNLGAIIC